MQRWQIAFRLGFSCVLWDSFRFQFFLQLERCKELIKNKAIWLKLDKKSGGNKYASRSSDSHDWKRGSRTEEILYLKLRPRHWHWKFVINTTQDRTQIKQIAKTWKSATNLTLNGQKDRKNTKQTPTNELQLNWVFEYIDWSRLNCGKTLQEMFYSFSGTEQRQSNGHVFSSISYLARHF